MSPEILERKSYGKASDIWSFGVIVLQILMMEESTKLPDVRKEISANPKYIYELANKNDYNETLAVLAIKCLNIDPTLRPNAKYLQDFMERQKKTNLKYQHTR